MAEDQSNTLTIARLRELYLEHCREFYPRRYRGGSDSYKNIRCATLIVTELFGDLPAESLGPKKLKSVQEALLAKGLVRRTINERIQWIKHMFKWAVSEELVKVTTWQALTTVGGLRVGRYGAVEGKGRKPVPIENLRALIHVAPPVLAAMLEVQLLTASRPGEIVTMRPCDIDRSVDPWLWRPENHKGSWRGHERQIPIIKSAQLILLDDFLQRPERDYCFSPLDAELRRRAERFLQRKTPIGQGNCPGSRYLRRGGDRARGPVLGPLDRYSTQSYAEAVRRMCKKHKIPHFTPHMIRHLAATMIRDRFGLDAVQAALGHRHAKISEVYAEVNCQKAAEVLEAIG